MNVRARIRRRLTAAAAALSFVCCVGCDDGVTGRREIEIEVDSSLTIWANLMPTFPAPTDRIHALVPVDFHNLSDEPVVVDAVRMVVRTAATGEILHSFRLEQITDWGGYVSPGGSGGGEWRKAESLYAGRLVCSESVAGTLWITALPEDGSPAVRMRFELDSTTLACVY